jgi:hypothetical protein
LPVKMKFWEGAFMLWGKDSVNSAGSDYIGQLKIFGGHLNEIIDTVRQIQLLPLTEAQRPVVTRTLRQLADSMKSGEQEAAFKEGLRILKEFESQLRIHAERA